MAAMRCRSAKGGIIAFAILATMSVAIAPMGVASAPVRHKSTAPLQSVVPNEVQIWLTTADRQSLLAVQPSVPLRAIDERRATIIVNSGRRYQRMVGFGAAITDATAFLVNRRLSGGQRHRLLHELFDRKTGIGLGFVRVTLGSSDFSFEHRSYDDRPNGERDPGLRHFSIAPARRDLLPVVRAARRINPGLTIMATPWSPPGWMKTSGSLIQGTLRDDSFQDFADYLRLSLQEFGRAGVPVDYLSLQNEPDFEPANYPGMRLSAAQRAMLIGHFVGPTLRRAGVAAKILEWDHNWDKPEQPEAVLADPAAASFISGVAWHCYAGDVAAQSVVHDRFPGTDAFFTECAGGEWAQSWSEAWPWMMRNVMIGTTRHWARGISFWNLALDEHYGPHSGGCSDCRGVVTIDSTTGAISRNPEYYALGHFSRFVMPGAFRVESIASSGELENVAFVNPDDSRVLVLFNPADSDAVVSIVERGRGGFDYRLPPHAAATFRWRPA